MTRNNYFVRLAGRVPRFGRVVVVLAAVAGLFAAVWTGSASAGSKGQQIGLAAEPYIAGPPLDYNVRICGYNQDGNDVCSPWTFVDAHAYDYLDVIPGWWWLEDVTICVDMAGRKAATVVQVDVTQESDFHDVKFWEQSRVSPTACDDYQPRPSKSV